MLYQLANDHIDLSKLECVSGIIDNGIGEYYFRFQINTIICSSPVIEKVKDIKLLRKNLIIAWREYKESK